MSDVVKPVLVEIVLEDKEEEEEDDAPCALSAKALRRSSGGSLHMRSFCVCGEEKLARRLSRNSLALQQQGGAIGDEKK
jgi:hypothetical protein